jgi:hypothetical protein
MDEDKHLNDFFAFLNDPKLWHAILGDIRALRSQYEEEWFEGERFSNASYYDRIEFDLARTFNLLNGEQIFSRRVLDHFPFPPITSYELYELSRNHLAGMDSSNEVEMSVTRFLAFVALETFYNADDTRISSEISIGGFKSPDYKQRCKTAWESSFGFYLSYSPTDNVFSGTHLNVNGKFSEHAMEELAEVMMRVAPTASINVQLLHAETTDIVSSDYKSYDFRNTPFDFDDELIGVELSKESNLFTDFLDAYFTLAEKKTTSFVQRLRNAAHLLVEADSQTNHAIALSLSFSAIEALVCEKTEGIVDELSRHVATLLQPQARDRPDAITAVKKYYNLRSKTLHGDHIVNDIDARWRVRALASAVFKACVDWKRHIAMIGADINRSDFLTELRTCSTTGQQIVGVSDGLAKFLPIVKAEK